jgi:HEAT repeat protein
VWILFVTLLVGRRLVLARAAARRVCTREALRPAALAIVDGAETTLADSIRTPAEARAFTELLAGYAHMVRGSARDRVASFFSEHGDLERELGALRSRSAQRRAAAAYRLGDMGSPATAGVLVALLERDGDRDVRSAAARSLGRLGATDAAPVLVAALVGRRVPQARAAQALIALGPAAVPNLLALLGSDEPHVRAWAAELVGVIGDASDGDALIRCLRDTSADVRARSARALGRLGAAAAASALRGTLHDRVPEVGTAAAFALGRLRDLEAVTALAELARTGSFDTAQAAASALSRIDPARLHREAARPGASDHLREAAARSSL